MDHKRTLGEKVADELAAFVGSWYFLFVQTIIMTAWVAGNIYLIFHFDPFPFIFLNLFMSAEAAYSTPIIMMSQNRAGQRDRRQAKKDLETNLKAEKLIEEILKKVVSIEEQRLSQIANEVANLGQAMLALLHILQQTPHEELPKPKAKKRAVRGSK